MANLPYISPELVQSYQKEIASQASPATSKRKTASLKKFFGWAKNEGHIQDNPIQPPVLSPQPVEKATPKRPHKISNFIKIGALVGLAVLIFLLVGKVKIPIPFRLAPASGPTASLFPTTNPTVAPELSPTPTPAPATGLFQELDPIFSKIYKDGVLTLEGTAPALKAIGGLLIEASSLVIGTENNTNGDIEITPDGTGIAHFLFEGTGENFLNAQAPNLTSGSLYYGIVANNSTGYNLLKLQSGSSPTTRFSVDALGNTYLGGNITIGNNLIIGGAPRFTNLGRLTSITGYYQDSGIFQIDQGGPDYANITKDGVTATADSVTFRLDETGQTASVYDTLVLSRLNGGTDAYALLVDDGDARFDGQLQLGRFGTNPGAIGEGSIIYNSTDDKIYFWNGTVWTEVGAGGSVSFTDLTSGTNITAAMVVGTGASLTYSGLGTINASTLNSLASTSFLRSDTSDNFTSGTLTTDAGTTFDVNGELEVSDANVSFNAANTTFTTTGDLTLSLGGGDLIFANDNTFNVGGSGSDVLYNAIADSVAGASVNMNSDDDLYIEGDLEVDGTITGDLSCIDCLDFTEFADNMTLDVATDIALGALTLSTSGTGALDFNSTGQVSFAGNVDAENGLDVTTADLTVGGANFSVAPATGNIITAGDIAVNGDTITSDGELTIDATSKVIIPAADTLESDDLTSAGALTLTSTGANNLTLDSGSGLVVLNTDDDLIPTLGASDADIGASGTRWDNIYGVTGNFSGTVTVNDLACTDCLDFTEFADNMTLDVATDIALGALTLSTSGTGALNFASTGQITFAGNVDATNGLDVTVANLTVGGANFSVDQANGNIITAGDIAVNGDTITSDGELTIDATSKVIIPAADTFESDDLTSAGALSVTSNTSNALTLDSGTTGAINIGTNANAKAITIGNTTTTTTVNLTKGATGNIVLTGFDCTSPTYTNGGSLTTDASGNIICSDDADGGVATSVAWSDITSPTGDLTLNHTATGQFITTMDWTATGALSPWTMNLANNAGAATTQNFVTINNALTAQTNDVNTETLLLLDNADTSAAGSTVVDNALLITNSGAIVNGITDAIDVTDAQIVNAINVGPNIILGSSASIDFTEFDVSGATGAVTIDDAGNLGQVSVEGTILDVDSLTFTAAGSLVSAGANAISLDSGTTGAVNIGTGVNDKTITIGNASANTSIVLTKGATGNITLTGFDCTSPGFTNGGVLTTDASGNIACGDDDSGAASVLWHEIGDPTDNQTLTMAAYTTIMNWTATGALSPWTMNLVNNAGAGSAQNFVTIANAVTTQTTDVNTESLLLLDNADTVGTGSTVVDAAILVTNSGTIANGITTGIDVSTAQIVNAINVGPNIILGTGATINFSEFDVSPTTGSITIADDGSAGQVSVDGTILDINSLTFVGAGTLASAGGVGLTIDSADGLVTFATDDDLIPTLGAGDADIGAAGTRWDNIYGVTGNFSGTVTVNDLTCTDCLDFTEFADNMTLDVATDIALGALTLSSSGTGALDFNSTGQVSFAGNVNAENGLDVTTANLTVGGANFSVAPATGNIITAGDIDVNGGNINSSGNIVITPLTTLTVSAATIELNHSLLHNALGVFSITDTVLIQAADNGPAAFSVVDDVDGAVYINADTTDNAEKITLGNTDKANMTVELTKGATGNIVLTGFDCTSPTYTNGGALTTDASGNIICSDDDSGGAASVAWNAITDPGANKTFAMTTYTTEFNWDTGTGANNLFSLTTDASSNGTGALLNIQTGASSTVLPLRVRAGAVEAITVDASGNVGIGQNTPTTALHVGNTSAETHPLSTGDVLINSDLEVDGILYLDGGQIAGTYGPGTVHVTLTSTPITNPDMLGLTSWLVQNDVNVGMAALMVDQERGGDIFSASTAGVTKFTIANNGNVSISGSGTMLTVGGGTGKVDFGTVDPVYNIDGTKYATFMSAMTGIKEESTGLVQTSDYVPGVGYRHTIDFKNQPISSDLWLFSKTTDLKDNIDKLIVLLSPADDTKVWYNLDQERYILSIYTAKPTTVSYRLTAPRFDYALWNNFNDNPESTGFAITSEDWGVTEIGEITPDPSLAFAQYQLAPSPNGFELQNSLGEIIGGFEAISNFIAANIRAGAIQTKELGAETLEAATASVDSLLVRSGLVSPTVKTALLSPLPEESDIAIQIGQTQEDGTSGFGELIIQDATGSAVASIDTSGNATFEGKVESQSLEVAAEATVAGTLYANDIKSTTLDDIQALLSQVEADQDLLKQAASWNINTATEAGTINYQQLSVNDLFVTNTLAAGNLSLSDSLTVGSDLAIQGNTINSLSAPLEIQSLAMAPVELMAGKVKIETNGDVTISGNLYVAGKIESTSLNIKASLDAADPLASIDASGSGKFKSVTTDDLVVASSEVSDASSIVNGEIATNATVGQAVIPAGVSEITIRNPKITDYTLVYVTPISSTSNHVLYVKSKASGFFTVGFSDPLAADVSFNWWIIQVNP
jgi:hypothetical protein